MTTTELEINKELVVSTANISMETDKWLTSSDSSGIVCLFDHEYGYRVYITQDKAMFKEEIQKLWSIGRWELAELMLIAEENGCKWLVLDCDGPKVPGRPEFNW